MLNVNNHVLNVQKDPKNYSKSYSQLLVLSSSGPKQVGGQTNIKVLGLHYNTLKSILKTVSKYSKTSKRSLNIGSFFISNIKRKVVI